MGNNAQMSTNMAGFNYTASASDWWWVCYQNNTSGKDIWAKFKTEE